MDQLSNEPSSDRRVGTGAVVVLALLVGVVLGGLGLASLARQAKQGFWDSVAARVTGRSLNINASLPTVIQKIQQLNRLETVVYTMDKIVEGDRESLILPDFLVGDKLILVAHGEVIAGVDLSQISAKDIQINGRDARLHLPEPQIFVTRLDSAASRVYSRNTGLLVSADPNLETEVRQKAEEQIRQAALTDGVLARAKANATSTMRTMLLGFGFEKVEVE